MSLSPRCRWGEFKEHRPFSLCCVFQRNTNRSHCFSPASLKKIPPVFFFFFYSVASPLQGPVMNVLTFIPLPPRPLWFLCPQSDWTRRITMTECCSAACNTSASTQSVLSSCAREFTPSPALPLPLQHTAAAAECVSSANNTHACDCEWVQPDSSS